ncbi:hypothetical protein SNARM312S_08366 [Streptomyces narbonensis]
MASCAGSGSPLPSPAVCRTTEIRAGSAAPLASKLTMPLPSTTQLSPETLATRNVPDTLPDPSGPLVWVELTPS